MMPTRSQLVVLALVALLLWAGATAWIRLAPWAFAPSATGDLSYLTAVPAAWASIWLIRRAASLAPGQLLGGVAVVGAVAMTLDGAALRWWPALYGPGEIAVRLGSAWLLWGYGLSLACALLVERRRLVA